MDKQSGMATFGTWLAGDWAIADEDRARRLMRPGWGIGAWLAVNLATGLLLHSVSLIGLPLVLLGFLGRRGPPAAWIAVTLLATMAFLAFARWSNGAGEWASGRGEFNLMLVLFSARCVWATWALPSVSRASAAEAFS